MVEPSVRREQYSRNATLFNYTIIIIIIIISVSLEPFTFSCQHPSLSVLILCFLTNEWRRWITIVVVERGLVSLSLLLLMMMMMMMTMYRGGWLLTPFPTAAFVYDDDNNGQRRISIASTYNSAYSPNREIS